MKTILVLLACACISASPLLAKTEMVNVEARVGAFSVLLGSNPKGSGYKHEFRAEIQAPEAYKGKKLPQLWVYNDDDIKTQDGYVQEGDLISFRCPAEYLESGYKGGIDVRKLKGLKIVEKSKIPQKPAAVPASAEGGKKAQIPWASPFGGKSEPEKPAEIAPKGGSDK